MVRRGVLLGGLAVVALLMSGCSKEVSAEDLEARITDEAEGLGLTVASVDCPGGLSAEVGATLTCEVEMTGPAGTYDRYQLEVTEVDGDTVTYVLAPLQPEENP